MTRKLIVPIFMLALIFAFGITTLSTFASGPYADSLLIVKPGDSLHWGEKVIGSTPVSRTVRLLFHGPDSLIGTVYSTNACFVLNDTAASLSYVIPDTNGVFQFTVSFVPTYRGSIWAWLYCTDPFDSIRLYASATGGTESFPMGGSLTDHSPISTLSEGVDAAGNPQPGYVHSLIPSIVYGGEGPLDSLSKGCLRAHITSVTITPDTTSGFMHWHTDSTCTAWYSYAAIPFLYIAPHGSGTAHYDTIAGLAEGTPSFSIVLHNARPLDPTCQVDTIVGFTTLCRALGSPTDFEIGPVSAPDSGFIAYWNTRTGVMENLRYYDTAIDTGWFDYSSWIEHMEWIFPMTHAIQIPIHLSDNNTYYVEIDGYNSCNDHLGWCDSLVFSTDAYGHIVGTFCPTITQGGWTAKGVNATSAKIVWSGDYISGGIIQWGLNAGAYGSPSAESGGDSATHYVALADLAPYTEYKYRTACKMTGCDTSSWSALKSFETVCPIIVESEIDSDAASTYATITWSTNYATRGGLRYAELDSAVWDTFYEYYFSASHSIMTDELAQNVQYKFEVWDSFPGCPATGWSDSLTFTTECPTIEQTNFVEWLAPESAKITWKTWDVDDGQIATHDTLRYGIWPNGGLGYYSESGPDSIPHYFSLTGLHPNTKYRYGVCSVFGTCTASEYSPEDTFTTPCPTVTMDDWTSYPQAGSGMFATVKITWTTNYVANCHMALDTLHGAGWQYYEETNHGEGTYDSLPHYVDIIGLEFNTWYWYRTNAIYEGCDSTAWSAVDSFLTVCPTVARSDFASQAIAVETATLHFHTDAFVHGGFRYHESPSGLWIYRHDADADSSRHSISIVGLVENTSYTWESMSMAATCDSSAYGDSTSFTTACTGAVKSGIATYAIAATSATLHLATDSTAHVGYRYHVTGNNAWTYRHDADADSISHTIAIAGLSGSTTYVWQSNAKHSPCDSSAWGDSTQFITPSACPTVATSNFASQQLATTSATLHFHTDYDVHAHYKYALYASGTYTYRSDADADSVQHTIGITGLTANHTRYKWLVNTKYTGCDSTAYGDQQDFYTTCTAISATYTGVCGQSPVNTFTITTDRACQVNMRYRKGTGTYTTTGFSSSTTDHFWNINKSGFSAGSDWNWEWQYIDECGTTSSWAVIGYFTIGSDGLCTTACD